MTERPRGSPRLLAAAAAISLAGQCAAVADTLAPASTLAVADFNRCAKPVWPSESLRKEQTGKVTLGFLIGSDGAVKDAAVLVSSGFALLDEAALKGISRCVFKPSTKGGVPPEVWMRMQYVRILDGRPATPAAAATDNVAAMRAAALNGDPHAQTALAWRLMMGQGMQQDTREAGRLYRLAGD